MPPPRRTLIVVALSFGLLAAGSALGQLPPAPVGVQVTTEYGIEFSTIGSPGNAPFFSQERPDWYPVQGRGSVGYTYGLARTEVTTSQWMEFVNTFSTQGGNYTQFGQPIRWGARLDPTYSGPGWRWQLDPARPQAADVPVWGLSWREAAMYCNFLHNDRSPDPAALTHGAYDITTFGYVNGDFFQGFTDQLTRSPGSRFWIPNLDEWLKGAFYDPAQARWWLSHYGSDSAPVYGYPGQPGAQSTAGLDYESGSDDYFIPLNAYSAQSAFGLLSTSGGPAEWFEDAVGPAPSTGLPTYRLFYQDAPPDSSIFRAGLSGELPHTGYSQSIRIATAIPAPSLGVFAACGLFASSRRRKS